MKIITRIFGFYFNTFMLIAPKKAVKQAFYFFSFPFKAKLKPHQQEFLDTSEMFEVTVDKKKVQGYTWGRGPEKILFVHGWQSNSYRWKALVEQLDKSRFTLIAFDAPGHGNSESKIGNVPLYEKSIDAVIRQIGDVDHFVGHSIGSFACASFAFHAQYPMKSFTSLASPFEANEFLDHFDKLLKTSERTQKHMKNYFKMYTGHPVDHYSLDVFAEKLNSERTLIIHDKTDKSTSYKGSQKFFDMLNMKDEHVEITLTEGLTHNLRGQDILDKVEGFVLG